MYRIFIVEDDAAIAQAVCEQAESWALEARCVSDFRRVAEEAAACLLYTSPSPRDS